MRIVPARPNDPAVYTMFERLHRYNAALNPTFRLSSTWRGELERMLGRRRRVLAHVACDPEPCGLIIAAPCAESPFFRPQRAIEIVALYVDPEHRHRGVAAALVECVAAEARQRGYARMRLFVTSTNEPAKAFYRDEGFVPVQEIWDRAIAGAEPAKDGRRRARLVSSRPARRG